MKHLFLFLISVLSCFVVQGQITTREEPVSYRSDIPAIRSTERAQKTMPLLDMEKIRQEDREDEAKGLPFRFGYGHEVNLSLENSGEWLELNDGGRLWRLEITCPGALSINLSYDKFRLPAGAKFFVYCSDRKRSMGAFTSENTSGDRTDMQGFATGLLPGDRITLEYYLPEETNETGVISVSKIVHGYQGLALMSHNTRLNSDLNNSCPGQVSINCPEGSLYQNEKNAVAMIVLSDGTRECTGSLINNTNDDNRPFFLTACHCALTDDDYGSMLFYWNYKTGCDDNNSSKILGDYTKGAVRHASFTEAISDFLLLELNVNSEIFASIGHNPYYLGWDRTTTPGQGGVGIHHPAGDAKRIAVHTMIPQDKDCNKQQQGYVNSNYWQVTWDIPSPSPSGNPRLYTVQGGSSGSPLLDGNTKRVIGQLNSRCNPPPPEYECYNLDLTGIYGKFGVSWVGYNNNDSCRLSNWLHPSTKGVPAPSYLNGRPQKYIYFIGPFNLNVGDSAVFTIRNHPNEFT